MVTSLCLLWRAHAWRGKRDCSISSKITLKKKKKKGIGAHMPCTVCVHDLVSWKSSCITQGFLWFSASRLRALGTFWSQAIRTQLNTMNDFLCYTLGNHWPGVPSGCGLYFLPRPTVGICNCGNLSISAGWAAFLLVPISTGKLQNTVSIELKALGKTWNEIRTPGT